MRVSVSDAKGRLTELVKRAEAGDEVILTRRGHDVVRLIVVAEPSLRDRRALMEKVRAAAAAKALPGLGAAHSQDFLYGSDGMPI